MIFSHNLGQKVRKELQRFSCFEKFPLPCWRWQSSYCTVQYILKWNAATCYGHCEFIQENIRIVSININFLCNPTFKNGVNPTETRLFTSFSWVRSYWWVLPLNCAIWLGPSLKVTLEAKMEITIAGVPGEKPWVASDKVPDSPF